MLLTKVVRMARVAALPAALLGTFTLGACSDERREVQTAPALAPSGPLLNTAAGDAVLDCRPGPNVSKRKVTPSTEGDLNGNGVVCDEQVGGPTENRKLTMDDIALPQPAVTP